MGGTDGEVGNTVVFRKEEVGPTLVAPLRAGMRFSRSGQSLAAVKQLAYSSKLRDAREFSRAIKGHRDLVKMFIFSHG